MSGGEKAIVTIMAVVLVAVLAFGAAYVWLPGFRATINLQRHAVQKADDATNYKTRKSVEDTARAMIASYDADVLTWEQYRDSDNAEKQGWAEQARMRANKTASSYNNYMLKNTYVWAGNIPFDIRSELPVVAD